MHIFLNSVQLALKRLTIIPSAGNLNRTLYITGFIICLNLCSGQPRRAYTIYQLAYGCITSLFTSLKAFYILDRGEIDFLAKKYTERINTIPFGVSAPVYSFLVKSAASRQRPAPTSPAQSARRCRPSSCRPHSPDPSPH